MRHKFFYLLVQRSYFTKLILFLYYSHITRVSLTAVLLEKQLKTNVKGKEAGGDRPDSYRLISRDVQADREAIASLVKLTPALPKSNSPLRIMPLGDSITHGVRGRNDRDSGGYRPELWQRLVAAGLQVEFVGSRSSGPESLGSKAHEGHPGWTIRQITAAVNDWLQASQPDLILLSIGTNDTGKSMRTMIEDLSALIDQITTQSPIAQLLVASIPPVHPTARPTIRSFRAVYYDTAIPKIIKSKADQGKKVDFVDMSSLTINDLTSSLSVDLDNGLHPSAGGYSKIALLWYSAILKFLSAESAKSSLTTISNYL